MSRYDWLAAMPQDTVFTVFDTETTGLEPRTNHVVEIGGIRFDGRGVISRFNVLVNPGVPMPPEAKLSSPGCLRINATSSPTVRAGTWLLTTSTLALQSV